MRVLLALVFTICHFFSILGLSWLLLYSVDFGYGFWHDHGGIGAAIEEFGPKNQHFHGFEDTTKAQRVDLFSDVNRIVHRGGEGLGQLTYTTPGGHRSPLFHQREIDHLVDVANLITPLQYIIVGALVIWLALIGLHWMQRLTLPGWKVQLLSMASILGLAILTTLIIGPKQVFSWAHEVAFAGGSQWFFYYQDSLMSTMMYAPVLFGWIAIEWVLLFIVIYIASVMLMRRR